LGKSWIYKKGYLQSWQTKFLQNLNLGLNFIRLDKTLIGRARWEDLPLPAAGRSKPAFGLVRLTAGRVGALANLDLLPARPQEGFFWVKPKERRKK